jgi:hypothetical protein
MGRVERFQFSSAVTVRKHAPWAARVVRVGPSRFVAYECVEDSLDEHGPVGAVVLKNKVVPRYQSTHGRQRCAHCLKPLGKNWGESGRQSYCLECANSYQSARRKRLKASADRVNAYQAKAAKPKE